MHSILMLLLAFAVPTSIYASCLSENSQNEIAPLPTSRSNLYRGQQGFTMSMLAAAQSATPNDNIFFSPYSTYHALLLAYIGSRGESEKELVQSLRLQWANNRDDVVNGYHFERSSRQMRAKKMPLSFESADKVFFDTSIELTSCVKDALFAELESKDFQKNAEESRLDINKWVANITHNEIPNLLSAGDITEQTQLVLANAAYFKGQWEGKFNTDHTKQELFYKGANEAVFVSMMRRRGTYNYATDDRLGAYILEIPYLTSNAENEESQISMVVFLPPPGNGTLEKMLAQLNPDSLQNALRDLMPREVDLALPKFQFEQNMELVPILRGMGIKSIFDHTADLSGFSAAQNLMFGDAKHFAKIKVDEEGSTAAAATVLFSFRSARPLEPTSFECNIPFLFLIYDHKAKAILFTGIYRDPKSAM